jgi:hypothetical protein
MCPKADALTTLATSSDARFGKDGSDLQVVVNGTEIKLCSDATDKVALATPTTSFVTAVRAAAGALTGLNAGTILNVAQLVTALQAIGTTLTNATNNTVSDIPATKVKAK